VKIFLRRNIDDEGYEGVLTITAECRKTVHAAILRHDTGATVLLQFGQPMHLVAGDSIQYQIAVRVPESRNWSETFDVVEQLIPGFAYIHPDLEAPSRDSWVSRAAEYFRNRA
jgi:hypothetical protein